MKDLHPRHIQVDNPKAILDNLIRDSPVEKNKSGEMLSKQPAMAIQNVLGPWTAVDSWFNGYLMLHRPICPAARCAICQAASTKALGCKAHLDSVPRETDGCQNATGKRYTWNFETSSNYLEMNLFNGPAHWLLHFRNCTSLEAHCHNLGDHFHNETA